MELFIMVMKSHQVTMGTMAYMEITLINTMHANIYMTVMTMIKINKVIFLIFILALSGCSLSPGMHMTTKSANTDNERVYIESIDKELEVINIVNFQNDENSTITVEY